MIQLMIHYLDIWSGERDICREQIRLAKGAPIAANFQGPYETLCNAIAWMTDLKENLEDGKTTDAQAGERINGYLKNLESELVHMTATAAQIRSLKDHLNTLKNL